MSTNKNTLQQDISTLNRRFLLIVQQMEITKHPLLSVSAPKWVIQKVKSMSLEEIDQLAEDMIAPCFHININELNFDRLKALPEGSSRKAYMTNVLVSQTRPHVKRTEFS